MSGQYERERRTTDRRGARDPNYAGPERRVGDRRKPEKEPRSKLGLAIGALATVIVADAALWDSQYRHAVVTSARAELTDLRHWSDHAWDKAGQ